MKKNLLWILAVLTVSVLMFSLIAVAATPAAANSLTITSESKTALAGDTVTVILKVTENPGVAYLRLTLEYDDALTLTNAENGTIIKDFDRGVNLMWSADANSTATGTLNREGLISSPPVKASIMALSFAIAASSRSSICE